MRPDEHGTLFCKLDAIDAPAEYGEARLVWRFIGVEPHEFNSRAFEEGVTAFSLDIDSESIGLHSTVLNAFCRHPFDCNACRPNIQSWFQIEYRPVGSSYAYLTFGATPPLSLTVTAIKRAKGLRLPTFPKYSAPTDIDTASKYQCSSFEVGQGMASMVYNESEGFLIDAGAGTPIKREKYQNKSSSLPCNHLKDLAASRKLRFFLSHGDSDHWRLLAWDKQLCDRVTEFVVPHGLESIPFFDKEVRARVRELSADLPQLNLGNSANLNFYRTSPPSPTSNNNGLVAVFENNGDRVLIAGDCVYSEMVKDNNSRVASLVSKNTGYKAVVVPHHGDDKSAAHVPRGTLTGANAFFSAGNHPTYMHPRANSLNEHKNAGYAQLCNKNPLGIREVPLI